MRHKNFDARNSLIWRLRERAGDSARRTLCALVFVIAAWATLSACAQEQPRHGLGYVEDEQFAIADPGGRSSAATGIGCAFSLREAETQAQQTAHYNLRGVIGPGRYRVQYEVLRNFRDGERYCAEAEARARY